MDENILQQKIDETVIALYQNREQEAMQQVKELLLIFQNMIQNQTSEQVQAAGSFALLMLRELLESYQNQDMIGMADCLLGKAVLFTQFYFQKN